MKHRLAVLISLTIAGVALDSAQADFQQQSKSATLTGPGRTAVMSFEQFDPALGTLIEVNLSYNFQMTAWGLVVNSAQLDPALVDFMVTASVAFTAPSYTEFDIGNDFHTALVNAGALETILLEDRDGVGNTIADQAPYYGIGSVEVTASYTDFTRSIFVQAGTPEFVSVDTATMTVDITLEYIFTPAPVPEPSSLALLGLAGVGGAVGAWRRRRAFQAVA